MEYFLVSGLVARSENSYVTDEKFFIVMVNVNLLLYLKASPVIMVSKGGFL